MAAVRNALPETSVLRLAQDKPAANDLGALAKRTLNAAFGNDTETALKLYDYGLDNFGRDFVDTYNTLKTVAESTRPLKSVTSIPTTVVSPEEGARMGSGLRSLNTAPPPPPSEAWQPVSPEAAEAGRTPLASRQAPAAASTPLAADRPAGTPIPTTVVSPEEADRLAGGGLRSLPAAAPPVALPPPFIPQGADAAVAAAMREGAAATDQYNAERTAAADTQAVKTRINAIEDARALVAGGLSPDDAIAEARKQPGVADVLSVDALRTALGLTTADRAPAPSVPLAPVPAGPAAAAGVSDPLAAAAGASLPREPAAPAAPDMLAGYTPGGLSTLPVAADAGEGGPRFSAASKVTTSGRTGGGVPRPVRPVVAPRNSPGLASLAAPAPAPAADGPPTPLTPPAAEAPKATSEPEPKDTAHIDPNDAWISLIAGGLGMMSSDKSTALGAIGEGGQTGLAQLNILRKEGRERAKDKSEAAYRKDHLGVQREAIASQDRRAGQAIESQERLQQQKIAAEERLLNQRLGAELQIQGMRINSEYDLLNARAAIEQGLAGFKADLERQGVAFKREDAFKFYKSKGLSDETSSLLASGHAPSKSATEHKPMGEKETTLSLDMLGGSVLGEGATGNQVLDQLPPNVSADVLRSVGSQSDPASGAAAGLQTLKKHGYVARDQSTFGGLFGQDMRLVPGAPPAAAAAPAGGTGQFTYVPGKGLVAK